MYTSTYTLYSGSLTTTPVSGPVVDLLGVYDKHLVEAAVTASSGGNTHVSFQGSLDGVNWYSLFGDTDMGPGVIVDLFGGSEVARYVQITAHVTSGTATVNFTGTSGLA